MEIALKPKETKELMERIFAAGKPAAVTQRVADEIKGITGIDIAKDMGIPVYPNIPAEKPDGADQHVLACITLEDGEDMRFPDNKTCKCSWGCERTVQHRPNVPDWIAKVCLHCLDDRPLKGHG